MIGKITLFSVWISQFVDLHIGCFTTNSFTTHFLKMCFIRSLPPPPLSPYWNFAKIIRYCIHFQNRITVMNLLSVIKRGMWTHIIFIHCVFSYEIVVILHAEIKSYGHLPDNCQTTIALAWFVQWKSCFWLVVVTVGEYEIESTGILID